MKLEKLHLTRTVHFKDDYILRNAYCDRRKFLGRVAKESPNTK